MAFYSPKEVEADLKIENSTLRKYASTLEKAGYNFDKNERGHRSYTDESIRVIRKLMMIKESTGMTLESSAKGVMTWLNNGNVATDATEETVARVIEEHSGDRYDDVSPREVALQEQALAMSTIFQDMQRTIHASNQLIQEQSASIAKTNEMISNMQDTLAKSEQQSDRQLDAVEKVVSAIEKNSEWDQIAVNQVAGLRREIEQTRKFKESKIEELDESKDKEKNRSFWQRLFFPSS